tara:strand:- start:1002 stop:1286 length:285 start_codon:yes stop_codon:yes gene_type:complete
MARSKPSNLTERPRGRNDDDMRMIRRFMKKIKKFRILEDYRETLVFEKPSTKRRMARKRRRKVIEKLAAEEKKFVEALDKDPILRKPKKKKTRR